MKALFGSRIRRRRLGALKHLINRDGLESLSLRLMVSLMRSHRFCKIARESDFATFYEFEFNLLKTEEFFLDIMLILKISNITQNLEHHSRTSLMFEVFLCQLSIIFAKSTNIQQSSRCSSVHRFPKQTNTTNDYQPAIQEMKRG